MKLRFFWRESFGKLEPSCESDAPFRDGESLLCTLLTDTGGLAFLGTLPWLEEGLHRLAIVQRGEAQSLQWGREDWGARFDRDRVEIHSLHDEDYADTMSPVAFETALRAWMDFIQTPPDAKTETTVLV